MAVAVAAPNRPAPAGRGDRALLDNRAIRLAHTAADALLVDVQASVIHTVHTVLLGLILKQASHRRSAPFTRSTSTLTYTFKPK